MGDFGDGGVCSTTGGTMNPGSCFGDPASPHGDREKPEVAAPGTNITTLQANTACGTSTATGTSFAAPHVAGAAALLIGRDLGLKSQPEAVKAILMASAFNNTEGAARLSEFDGAGGINVASADDIVRKGRFTAQVVGGADFDGNNLRTLGQVSVAFVSAQRLKVAIAWSSAPGFQEALVPGSLTIANDFDLHVYLVTGNTEQHVGTSNSWDNSYEVVDIPNPVPGTYVIKAELLSGTLLSDSTPRRPSTSAAPGASSTAPTTTTTRWLPGPAGCLSVHARQRLVPVQVRPRRLPPHGIRPVPDHALPGPLPEDLEPRQPGPDDRRALRHGGQRPVRRPSLK